MFITAIKDKYLSNYIYYACLTCIYSNEPQNNVDAAARWISEVKYT